MMYSQPKQLATKITCKIKSVENRQICDKNMSYKQILMSKHQKVLRQVKIYTTLGVVPHPYTDM